MNMQGLTGIDINNATMVAIYYQTHSIPQRFNAGIIVASTVVSILGSYASLFLLGKRTSNSGTRNIVYLILAAITMAFVGIWSMHFIGMYMRLEATPHISWYIRYNPGFAVFSFITPAIALIVSFLFLDHDANGFRFWKVVLAGTLTGCTVAMMHYSASFYCNFVVSFAPIQVVSSIIYACVLTIVGFTAFFRFRSQWQDSWWKMGACAISIGFAVSGMHYVGVSGTSYRVKWDNMDKFNLEMGRERNLLLVCVIAAVCFFILFGITVVAVFDTVIKHISRKRARMLVVASATFDKTGRLMVNGDGTLPLMIVEEKTLRRSEVLEALDQRSSVFHWLYAVSWDWSIVTPFLKAIASKTLDKEKKSNTVSQVTLFTRIQKAKRAFTKGSHDLTQDSMDKHTDLFDFRDKVVNAAHRLAQDLDIELPSLGIFYDHILPTGTRKAAEKIKAKDPFGGQLHLDEETRVISRPPSIFGKGEEEAEGVTMFIVREVEQDELNLLAKRGYRFTDTKFLSSILADRHGVQKEEMDNTLEGLRQYAKRGTKPIVQPGGYYAGLFCVRPNASHHNGNLDILVYDFARHQIPAFRLPGITTLTTELITLLTSIDGKTIENVLLFCNKETVHLQDSKRRIAKLLQLIVNVDDQIHLKEEQIIVDTKLQFQQSLFTAIKTLEQTMYFIPNLLQTAKFNSKMVELPSSLVDVDADSAHLLLVQVILPMEKRNSSIEPSTPFIFTPYTLFAKTQMMMLGGPPAEEFERGVISELEKRYELYSETTNTSEGDMTTTTTLSYEMKSRDEEDKTSPSRLDTHVLTYNREIEASSKCASKRLSVLGEESLQSIDPFSESTSRKERFLSSNGNKDLLVTAGNNADNSPISSAEFDVMTVALKASTSPLTLSPPGKGMHSPSRSSKPSNRLQSQSQVESSPSRKRLSFADEVCRGPSVLTCTKEENSP